MPTETLTAEGALYTRLVGDSTLTALLAQTGDGQPAIYPLHGPEFAQYPFLIYAQLSGADQQPLMTLRAQSKFRYLISVINAVQDTTGLDAILARVDALLNNYTVASGGSTVAFLRYQPPLSTGDPNLGKEYRKVTVAYWVWVTN